MLANLLVEILCKIDDGFAPQLFKGKTADGNYQRANRQHPQGFIAAGGDNPVKNLQRVEGHTKGRQIGKKRMAQNHPGHTFYRSDKSLAIRQKLRQLKYPSLRVSLC